MALAGASEGPRGLVHARGRLVEHVEHGVEHGVEHAVEHAVEHVVPADKHESRVLCFDSTSSSVDVHVEYSAPRARPTLSPSSSPIRCPRYVYARTRPAGRKNERTRRMELVGRVVREDSNEISERSVSIQLELGIELAIYVKVWYSARSYSMWIRRMIRSRSQPPDTYDPTHSRKASSSYSNTTNRGTRPKNEPSPATAPPSPT